MPGRVLRESGPSTYRTRSIARPNPHSDVRRRESRSRARLGIGGRARRSPTRPTSFAFSLVRLCVGSVSGTHVSEKAHGTIDGDDERHSRHGFADRGRTGHLSTRDRDRQRSLRSYLVATAFVPSRSSEPSRASGFEVVDQQARGYVERLGDSDDRVQGDVADSPFHVGDVRRMESGQLPQPFLTHPHPVALFPNPAPERARGSEAINRAGPWHPTIEPDPSTMSRETLSEGGFLPRAFRSIPRLGD